MGKKNSRSCFHITPSVMAAARLLAAFASPEETWLFIETVPRFSFVISYTVQPFSSAIRVMPT